MRKNHGATFAIFVLAIFFVMTIVCGCTQNDEHSMLKAENVAFLDEIQELENLTFEWLRPYHASRPTAIVIHGEMTGKGGEKFTMALDGNEYTFKPAEESGNGQFTDYVVNSGIGMLGAGLDLNLANYWLDTAEFNVAIFHWERFADEENPDDILAKLISVPKMRYVTDAGYETSRVPRNSLVEVFAAVYAAEMADKANGREIRFIGNGVGADLALGATHLLAQYADEGLISSNCLPRRLTLCDPYLPTTDPKIADDVLPWADIDTSDGFMSVADVMFDSVAEYGCAVELVESVEVVVTPASEPGAPSVTTMNYAYDIEKSESTEKTFENLKEKVAYLLLRESYSTKFSDEYMKLKRIALDWYLYSIIGSDDTGNNGGGSQAPGYPHDYASYQSNFTYSSFNWGPNRTRPMMNNRQMTNDSSSSIASSRGKNYSLSAWTPTTYARAQRGMSFKMMKYLSTSSLKDAHNNSVYNYSPYTMPYFRTENFQVSDQCDNERINLDSDGNINGYTLICGYVYKDLNGDKEINDGFSGVAGAQINVVITRTVGTTSNREEVARFSVYTAKDGFYSIRLEDKWRNSEGELSDTGYAFDTTHTVSLTVIPNSHDYVSVSGTASGIFYELLNRHNFTGYTSSLSISNYYADAITVSNCLVGVPK